MKINQIRPLETEFTELLEPIVLKPKTLYYYGKMPEKRVKSVAIVGARRNTSYGEEVAYHASYALAQAGVVVVSGLALGIDSIAHRGALDAGGTTIAVLGTPIDQIHPVRHAGLAEKIANNGCVISEYPSGMMIDYKRSFLARNRIISGLADAVLIVEAGEKSGSLNTAMHALDQGKDLWAVPGDINRPFSKGCNKLLSQGAGVYTQPDDILMQFFPERYLKKRKNQKIIGDNQTETLLLQTIADGVQDGEGILEQMKTKMPRLEVSDFNQTVTMLEIKGRLKNLGANRWMLI